MPITLQDSLITWTGMIQDTSFSPEIYSSDGVSFEDRTVVYAVTPPGIGSYTPADDRVPLGIPQKLPFDSSSSQGLFLRFGESISQAADLKPTEIYTFTGELEELPFPHSEDDTLYPSLLVSSVSAVEREYESPNAATATTYLTQLLKGDALTARFLLIHLTSPSPSTLCISQLPAQINLAINGLLLHLPLTLERLNAGPIYPYSSEMGLHSSPLQLPKHSNLWLNETALSTGVLNSQGTKNIAALRDLVQSKRVGYAFEFSTFYFDATFNVLSTTESRRSILEIPAVNVLPYLSESGSLSEDMQAINLSSVVLSAGSNNSQSEVENIFSLIDQVQTLSSSFVISDTLAKTIETNFVQLRQTQTDWNADRLARTINIAKILALIEGQVELSLAHWKGANSLEQSRLDRSTQ